MRTFPNDGKGFLLSWPLISLLCSFLPVLTNFPVSDFSKGLTTTGNIFIKRDFVWDRANSSNGVPLSVLCPAGSRVLVWGWSAQLFAFYDWMPATRYPGSAGVMANGPIPVDNEALTDRYVREVQSEMSEFDCVVDATGPSFFPGFSEDKRMSAQMPALWKILTAQGTEQTLYWDGVNPFQVIHMAN
jgi:hypothetical protein